MSILHITHIKNDVLKNFDGLVDVSDLKQDTNGYEVNKLSRSLSAYGIYSLCEANPADIAKGVVDGSDDNGIDCIYFDEKKLTMYFSQAKWEQDGNSSPSVGDVKKFADGIRDLVNFRFDRFNSKVNLHKQDYESVFSNPNVKFVAVLVYTSVNDLAEPVRRELDDLLSEMNDASEIMSLEILNQKRLHSGISQKLGSEPISEIIELKNWGKIDSPNKAFYGQINGYVLASWWSKYKEKLFAKNIRNMLGDSEVNSEIKKTIAESPELFWYYNNGITIIADSIKKSIEGGGNTDLGKFTCENISVINGAQTVSSLGRYSLENEKNVASVYVQCRVIEAGSISNELSGKITRTNNRQNRIENRDFISQDIQQKRIHDELLPEGYDYIIQRGSNFEKNNNSIDVQEATVALVCASGDVNLVVQLKREIGKLWEDITKVPYIKIYNPATNALYLLHVVLIQRKIEAAINRNMQNKNQTPYEKAIYSYGNRLISAKIFEDLPCKNLLSSPTFDVESLEYDFVSQTKIVHDKIKNYMEAKYPKAMISPFFKNFSKCTDVFENM